MPDINQSPTGAQTDDLFLELEQSAAPTIKETEVKQIPDKYRGKSVEDLIDMHQNAERRLSQQGNELGEVRRLADSLIGLKQPVANAKQAPERKPVTVEALLDNPAQVLEQALSTSAVAQQTENTASRLDKLEGRLSQTDFVSRFPGYQEDMQNPEFMAWVQKNPLRATLATQAYNQDFGAAANLWDLWDEHKELAGNANASARTAQTREKLNQAKTGKQGASEGAPPRTYSREKLMELRAKVADGDPASVARWNNDAFQASLIQAYAEGRVK